MNEPYSGPYSGTVAVVTGAASGIGAALATALASRGATVIAVDVDAVGLARHLTAGITTETLDVTNADAVTALILNVAERHGQLDYVFNNAGIVAGGDFERTDDMVWSKIVDVNLWGVVHGTRAAYDVMLEQGSGHIVNTASSAGVLPVARSVAYATTKHAVMGLSTSLRAEAASKGIKVSVVVPGLVDSAIFDAATNVGDYDYKRFVQKVPFAMITPGAAADYILNGVAHNRQQIVFPFYNRVICALTRALPASMSRVVNR